MSNLLHFALNRSASILRTCSIRISNQSSVVQKLKNVFVPRSRLFRTTNTTNCSNRPYDVNTNLTKDVIIYKYENPKYYKMLNIFALCQFVFWNYLSHFAYTTLKDAPVAEEDAAELAWYQRINLGDNKYRNGIAIFCFVIGYGILAASWMFTLRSVRFLILRKGGKEVAFVTYTPFGKNRILNVPLKNISAQESREISKSMLPLKVRDRSFYYVLDMRGEFRNAQLFDYTVGINRRI